MSEDIMPLLRISTYSSRELQGLLVRLKGADKETRKRIRQVTKADAGPIWTSSLNQQASTRLEARVLAATGRVKVSDQNVTLTAATVGRKLTGGLNPKTDYHGVEFGAEQGATSRYEATSIKGRRFTVERRTRAQLRPVKRTGYVVYPAAAEAIPRLASLWVQTAVRTLHELVEGK
jgi:hypothetical protein